MGSYGKSTASRGCDTVCQMLIGACKPTTKAALDCVVVKCWWSNTTGPVASSAGVAIAPKVGTCWPMAYAVLCCGTSTW